MTVLTTFFAQKEFPISLAIALPIVVMSFSLWAWNQFDSFRQRNSIRYKLSYNGVWARFYIDKSNPGFVNIDVGIEFLNSSTKKLYYHIEDIRVVIGNRTTTVLPRNFGGYIIPNKVDVFYYPTIAAVSKTDAFEGTISYTCTYGVNDKKRPYKIKQVIKTLFLRNPSNEEIQKIDHILEYET